MDVLELCSQNVEQGFFYLQRSFDWPYGEGV